MARIKNRFNRWRNQELELPVLEWNPARIARILIFLYATKEIYAAAGLWAALAIAWFAVTQEFQFDFNRGTKEYFKQLSETLLTFSGKYVKPGGKK